MIRSAPPLRARLDEEEDVAIPALRPDRLPLFSGDGPLDYACGRCDEVVCAGMHPGALAGLVLRCRCGAIAAVPAAEVGGGAP
ncbi:MAG TPA: hypothetical protein VFP65_25460 [Anaeromyxobacteraceae bacterium]|nr:hypothetical protein [Anaeromyxobacteraceae bacterium]